MQDRDVTKRRFGFLHFVIFIVPFASFLAAGLFHVVVFFAKLGLLSYFFAVLTALGIILFVYDHFNGKSK